MAVHAVGDIRIRGQREREELVRDRHRRGVTGGVCLLDPLERNRPDIAELRPNQHVVRREPLDLVSRTAPREEAHELPRDRNHGREFIARRERRADVDSDHDVGTHAAHCVDGEVLHHAAVAEQTAVDLNGCDRRRDRQACAYRLRNAAALEDHCFAGRHVDRNCIERNRQVVEIHDVPNRQHHSR